jgi:hypothetical protein
MENILKEQYLLFNNFNIINLNFVIEQQYLIYDEINNINDINDINDINLENILWKYDNNNYRIPYVDNIKIKKIKLTNNLNIYDLISSNSIIPDEEIICGENIQSICDIVLVTNETMNCNPNNLLFSKKIMKISDINNLDDYKSIYVKTDDLKNLYNSNINIKNKIIITHNSDYEITKEHINNSYFNKIHKQLSQNCLVENKNLIPIPIGIENRQWLDHEIFHKIRKRKDIIKTKDIYFFFSLNTHHERNECFNLLKHKLCINEQKSKEEYFIELKKHKFAICPRGNGIDTHRLWECFYLDVIPIIIKKDFINIHNLPIIIFDSWNDFEVDKLYTEFNNIKNSKIFMNYYKNII